MKKKGFKWLAGIDLRYSDYIELHSLATLLETP